MELLCRLSVADIGHVCAVQLVFIAFIKNLIVLYCSVILNRFTPASLLASGPLQVSVPSADARVLLSQALVFCLPLGPSARYTLPARLGARRGVRTAPPKYALPKHVSSPAAMALWVQDVPGAGVTPLGGVQSDGAVVTSALRWSRVRI
jgi:hypothetical protein